MFQSALLRLSTARLIALAMIGLLATAAAQAQPALDIRSAEAEFRNGRERLDANIELEFSAPIRRALEHGVPVTLRWQARLEPRERSWWRRPLRTADGVIVVRFHSLSRHWLVRIGSSNEPELRFASRRALLAALSDWRGIELDQTDWSTLGSDLQVRLKVKLDIWSLPAPLRLPAWLSPAWQLESTWFEFPVRAPTP